MASVDPKPDVHQITSVFGCQAAVNARNAQKSVVVMPSVDKLAP